MLAVLALSIYVAVNEESISHVWEKRNKRIRKIANIGRLTGNSDYVATLSLSIAREAGPLGRVGVACFYATPRDSTSVASSFQPSLFPTLRFLPDALPWPTEATHIPRLQGLIVLFKNWLISSLSRYGYREMCPR
ncbi:hypothetical protein E2C01_100596 [Portunus trituberculatus]|uniref:Uncharacterized protein n=1 Tax=Portunus trituberculatus TaxID=210409 RepID=A0A5B7KJV2_PORTR|nr:hypothetical protein [Portunus trituberculatus]